MGFMGVVSAYATWTSLIPEGIIAGIQIDVNTVITGFMVIFATIAGFAILLRVFR